MSEFQTKTTEQIFEPNPIAQEYTDIADTCYHLLERTEGALVNSKSKTVPNIKTLTDHLRNLSKVETRYWAEETDGSVERFESILELGPRQTERLIEMAWEIRHLAIDDIYVISSTAGAETRKKSRQITNSEKLADNLVSYSNKYELDDTETKTLADLLSLESNELEDLWEQFENVAHKAREVEITRDGLEDKLETDELERKRKQKRARTENDAVSAANAIRNEARKALFVLDPRVSKRGGFSELSESYDAVDSRSEWAAAPIVDFLEAHPDKRRKQYKEEWPKLQEGLLQQIVGQTILEHVKSGLGSDRNEFYGLKIKGITGQEDIKGEDLQLSPAETRQLGALLLAEYRNREVKIERRRQVINKGVARGSEAVSHIDRRLDKVAENIVDLFFKS